MKGVLHVVWSICYPGPRYRAITDPIPRPQAIRIVQDKWIEGYMARLEPPLKPTHINKESSPCLSNELPKE